LVEMTGVDRRNHATVIATVVNMLGLGCGPLLAGFLAEYGPVPLRLPYGVHLLLLIPAAIGVWRSPETVEVQPGARTRLQRLVVPPQARTAFVPAALSVFAAFAVFGLLTAIEPGFLATLLHLPNLALAGTAVFFMFAGSALGQVGLARMPGQIALPAGCLVLVAGLASIALALVMHSLPPLLIGTVVVGVGQGMSFRAGMAAITQNSPTERRAETVSSFFVVIYVGISLPVILVGLATQAWGLRTAGIAFTIAVAVLAITALVAILRMAPRNQTHHLESVKQR
jgi:MFS family permease